MTNSSSDDEYKPGAVRHEKFDAPPAQYGADAEAYDHIEEKRLVRKIDWRLLPILGALYSISLVGYTFKTPKGSHSHGNRSIAPTSPTRESQAWAPT